METTPISPLRTFCWGILHAIGMFELSDLTNAEKAEGLRRTKFFETTAGLVLAQVVDPVSAEKVAEMLAGFVP